MPDGSANHRDALAIDWPTAEAWHEPAMGGALLAQLVQGLGATAGRLELHASGRVWCNVDGRHVTPVRTDDWVERQVLAIGGPVLVQGTRLPYFTEALNIAPPTHLLAAPILRDGQSLGTCSLGFRSETLPPQLTEQLTAVCARIATLEPALPPRVEEPALFSTLFSDCPWPLLLAAADRGVLAVNAAAERMLSQSAAELHRQTIDHLFPLDPSAELANGRWTVMIPHPDGAFPVEVSSCLFPEHADNPSYLLLLHDRREDRFLFEERVKTAELSGIFRTIATVNHEINNPLFGIMATLQLLRDELGPQNASVTKKLDRMEKCSERIKQITDDLSQVIRPARRTYMAEEGMLDLDRAKVGIRGTATERAVPMLDISKPGSLPPREDRAR